MIIRILEAANRRCVLTGMFERNNQDQARVTQDSRQWQGWGGGYSPNHLSRTVPGMGSPRGCLEN